MSYCSYVIKEGIDPLHKAYHDSEYGFPIEGDDQLFGRLILEINQAGLSWITILKKKDNFQKAYSGFDVNAIANYGQLEIERLLADQGIIRNKLKINAAIYNARQVLDLQQEFGSFKAWLDYHHPLERNEWVKLFKKVFKFTGGEITNEFLISTGYLKGAHEPSCPVFKDVLSRDPRWRQ